MTTSTATAAPTAEFKALKDKLKATWSAGNYDYFSRFMESSATELLDRLQVPAGAKLLDVATGSGQLALAAARRGVRAWGADIATNSIEAARERANVEGLDVRFDEGDAEALPYEDGSFDVVTSIFGAMFAPRPDVVASELARVTRRGGTIALANWTPAGFIGQMFKTMAKHVPPPPMPSPVLWGDESTVQERLGRAASSLELTRQQYRFEYPFTPVRVVEFFREFYGPTNRGFASLGEREAEALRADLEALWSEHNESLDAHRTIVSAEYLQVVAVRA